MLGVLVFIGLIALVLYTTFKEHCMMCDDIRPWFCKGLARRGEACMCPCHSEKRSPQ